MGMFNSERNFGFGRQMGYAGRNALNNGYQGHFTTVSNHSENWGQFTAWAKENEIRDATQKP